MTDFSKLKVTDLRAELKKRGLPQTGLKPVLVARLENAENDDGSESENTIQGDSAKLDTNSAASPDTVSPILPSPNTIAQSFLEPLAATEFSEPAPDVEQDPATTTLEAPAKQIAAIADVDEGPVPSTAPVEPKGDQSALPSVEPQEAIEDRQKRKRRSESPSLSATDIARKRFRPSISAEDDKVDSKVNTAKEDGEWIGKHNVVDGMVMDAPEEPGYDSLKEQAVSADSEKKDIKPEHTSQSAEPIAGDEGATANTKIAEEGPSDDSPTKRPDSRFKDLFKEEINQDETIADNYYPEEEQDRIIAPAMHPATSALYIRDIMRPLNAAALKSHLTTLAAAPSYEADPEVILDFHIDQIRTHAFVSFTSVSAASRVRSALHDRIWPDEKTRKPLWIDFVPVEKVNEWIEIEQAANPGRAVGKKWEVVYDMDQDRNVTAALQEISNLSRHNTLHQQSFASSAPLKTPTEPRFPDVVSQAPMQIRGSTAPTTAAVTTNHSRLTELFQRTTAKPFLYFKPVASDIVNKRLDALDSAISKKVTPGEHLDGPVNRYTFEDDTLVDRGPEIFPGLRPPPGFRGPAFDGGRPPRGDRGPRGGYGDRSFGGNRGGHGGRGNYGGDSYRSSGGQGYGDRAGYGQSRDGYRGGQPDRRYDSYRGGRRESGGYDRR